MTVNYFRKMGWGALCAAVAVSLFAAGPARAGDDPVAARVNGAEIHLSEVKAAQDLLPAQLRAAPFADVYGALLDSLINAHLAAADAKRQGLERTDEYKNKMARIGEQVLERMALARYIEKQLTEDKLKARYETLRESKKGQFEVHARHILVKDEDEAKKIIAQLDKGKDFAQLAKERSIGPSAKDGGDLGWFGPGRTVPAFEKAAMALPVGGFTHKPVKTQFGWHVIKVEERRALKVLPFAAMRAELTNAMSAELGQRYMAQLREAATIEKKPLPDGK